MRRRASSRTLPPPRRAPHGRERVPSPRVSRPRGEAGAAGGEDNPCASIASARIAASAISSRSSGTTRRVHHVPVLLEEAQAEHVSAAVFLWCRPWTPSETVKTAPHILASSSRPMTSVIVISLSIAFAMS